MLKTEPSLQPLRVTQGWRMDYNNGLYQLDIDPVLIPEDERWWIFKEDMLQMSHEVRNRIIDIGFTPEGDFDQGRYNLVMYEGDFTGTLIAELRTQDRKLLVSTIEKWMREVTANRM